MKVLSQGAESTIFVDGDTVHKERLRKMYRIDELDSKIRRSRTRKEAKILRRLETLGLPAPRLIEVRNTTIVMERIDGVILKKGIEDTADPSSLFHELGVLVSRLHNAGIIHGDLTTSNFILGKRIYVVDFGLSFISSKDEDKAVDLYVFERAVGCAHDVRHLEDFYHGYGTEEHPDVMRKLEAVRMRGRKREDAMVG